MLDIHVIKVEGRWDGRIYSHLEGIPKHFSVLSFSREKFLLIFKTVVHTPVQMTFFKDGHCRRHLPLILPVAVVLLDFLCKFG